MSHWTDPGVYESPVVRAVTSRVPGRRWLPSKQQVALFTLSRYSNRQITDRHTGAIAEKIGITDAAQGRVILSWETV
ncbi:MAG: hypothetical protein ACJ746_10255 [Bryobacteraceae bacterium]